MRFASSTSRKPGPDVGRDAGRALVVLPQVAVNRPTTGLLAGKGGLRRLDATVRASPPDRLRAAEDQVAAKKLRLRFAPEAPVVFHGAEQGRSRPYPGRRQRSSLAGYKVE